MQKKRSIQLRFKAVLGLTVFILLVIASSLYQFKTLKLSEQNHRLLGELDQLEQLSDAFHRRSENYLTNAPRDYESYFRDVAVFHKNILQDIDQFSDSLNGISDEFNNSVGFAVPRFLLSFSGQQDLYASLSLSVQSAQDRWQTFLQGFHEKLGDNKDEPRIEWGAKYIIESHPELNKGIKHMSAEYKKFLEQQSDFASLILKTSIILITILGVLGLVWFYRRVIRRISATIDACEQVASGDFGYTLPVEGNDEISVLSKAFNTLSSRSQLVLAMLDDLQQTLSIEQALTVISKAAGSYLPLAWVGFLEVSADKKTMTLTKALPAPTLKRWAEKSIARDKGFGEKISASMLSKEPIIINDLREYAVSNAEERFIRELVRTAQVEALMALAMTSSQGWEGVLLFASRAGEYRKDQTELLQSLSQVMANNFERMQRDHEHISLT